MSIDVIAKPETKVCQNCKQDFVIEPDDFLFYEKMKVPPPEKCPQCRQQLRMHYRNFKTLYKRQSSKSGNIIVSMYKPEVVFPVYDHEEWWSDDWDPMSYERDFDFERSFFEQLADLYNKVPHVALVNTKSVNCDYSNMTYGAKNCYFIFGCLDNEDCDYGHIVWNSRDTVDNLYIFECESCYECVDCIKSTKLLYSQECESCVDSIGLFDCRNCLNCIGCVGLNNKSYHIFNKPVTKEEYKEFLQKHPLYEKSTIDHILKERDALRKKVPQRYFFGSHNNNVSGNHIYNAKNVQYSFDIKSGEDSKYCFTVRKVVDSFDITFTGNVSESYQTVFTVGNKILGSHLITDSHDIYYSDSCHGSNDLFGCFGLRKKSYCILNKQYTKEEYEKLIPKIIEHMKNYNEWGEFFPLSMIPFAYNESIVNEYMPLSKENALSKGFTWADDIPFASGQETIQLESLPKNPVEYSDTLLKEILACKKCKRNYKLIQRELNFYKKMNLPLPQECFNCRHEDRMNKRNPRNLWNAKCAHCGKDIVTSYKPEDQKIYKIYCEQCYQAEVV